MEKEFKHNVVGIGWIDDEARVAVSIFPNCTQYLAPETARYFAMQILMTANEIDPPEEEEEK